jgi:peptide/nickel transport system substrate-binding protein
MNQDTEEEMMALAALIEDVRRGALSRRAFVRAAAALGLAAPLAQQLLPPAAAQEPARTPARRGGGGALRALWWQAATILNPHLTSGLKDIDGARLCYEPLASFDAGGALVPVLAREIPTVDNGGLARDGLSALWRLKRNVVWQDGQPFTAGDVAFTWEYAADPATTATTLGAWDRVEKVERVDTHAARIVFKRPTPYWAEVGTSSILPRHVFQPWTGAKAREAPANLKPVGTGPYRIVDFRPGDLIRAELNPHYHVANRPFFDAIEVKGGGDAVSAARAVLQTGEYDYAWNLQVEDDVLQRLERGGKGRIATVFGGAIEHILVNQSDPWTDVDGERGSAKSVHPVLTDPAVRQALKLLVDRAAIQREIYGRAAVATGAFVNEPARFRSPNAAWEFSVEKAAQALEAAGWRPGPDGIRARNGVRLKLVFQTSVNGPRQKTQAIVKRAAARAGVDVEIRAIAGSTFFSSDPGNTDTAARFQADLQMYTVSASPDPEGLLRLFTSAEIAARANKWQRRNVTRFRSDEYDRTFRAAEVELDPAKRAALLIRLNDMLVQQAIVVPVVARGQVAAVSSRLKDVALSGWEPDFWRVAYWRR